MRSRNCDFWPDRPLTRTSNSLVSLAMIEATSGSLARLVHTGGEPYIALHARHDRGNVGIAGASRQHRREPDLVRAALLGLQPRRARPQAVEILGDDRK